MYPEDIFYPLSPMFSTFDGKMVNVVENAECFNRMQSQQVEVEIFYFIAYLTLPTSVGVLDLPVIVGGWIY